MQDGVRLQARVQHQFATENMARIRKELDVAAEALAETEKGQR